MTAISELPRWSLAFVAGIIGCIFAWSAWMLPWSDWTVFSVVTSCVGLAHLLTAGAAAVGHPVRARLWRVQAVVALTFLAYVTWNLVWSATYVAELYGGLGRGVAAALGLVWVIVVGLTVPVSAWGLSVTGGVRRGKVQGIGAAVLVVLAAVGLVQVRAAAAADPLLGGSEAAPQTIEQTVARALPPPSELRALPQRSPSLFSKAPAVCDQPVGPGVATIVATYVAVGDVAGRPAATTLCVQGPSLDAAAVELGEKIAEDGFASRVKVDVIIASQPLQHIVPVVDGLSLRPGIDGVCQGNRCLMPWQLLALNMFVDTTPIPVVPELRFGFDPAKVRRALEGRRRREPADTSVEGLLRIETYSLVTDADGVVHHLHRLREPGPTTLQPQPLAEAVQGAEDYILAAQGPDGRFEYKRNPFTGRVQYRGFSLARQAGTTLVVCELAQRRAKARKVAAKALAMMATTERRVDDMAALAYPINREFETVRLGSTALASIAFLSCRDLVGDQFDETIERLTRFLLTMQRPNGSFFPKYDLNAKAPVPGPDPLYAVGQAVFALTLLEQAGQQDPAVARFADPQKVGEAVERAMQYVANDYWQTFARDFFFMEENWHCLAARASLQHHRNPDYEQFCLDYVDYKTRLILAHDDGVTDDFVGGYGFGNVLIPHNTGSAGFGEAMSAALAVRRERGEALEPYAVPLRRALRFLLHHQWDAVNCFACAEVGHPVHGAFSEHMASAEIRIDYVQHALAGMGHGGRILGLLDGDSD